MESAETERREICKMLKYNIEPTEVQFVKSVLKPATKDEAVSCMSGGGYQQGFFQFFFFFLKVENSVDDDQE